MAYWLLLKAFMRTGLALLALVLFAASAAADAPAAADPGPAPSDPAPPSITPAPAAPGAAEAPEHYGITIVMADAMSLTATSTGDAAEQDVVRGIGFGAAIVGAPLLHLAHGNRSGAFKSLALRLTIPLATAYLGKWAFPGRICFETANSEPSQGFCGSADQERIKQHHVMGFVVGLAAVSVFDATVLAKQPVKRSTREWRPDLTFRDGGMRATIRWKW